MSWFLCCYRNAALAAVQVEESFTKVHNPESVPYFTLKGTKMEGIPTNVYDGDTFGIVVDFHGKATKFRCRSLGYDSPEMKPSLANANRLQEIELAKKARIRFIELLSKKDTITVECFDFDKYGRVLVNIWNGVDQETVNEIMIREKHGRPYDGGKKEAWF